MRLIYVVAVFSVFIFSKYADALLAAMAVDFGSENMKIALVKPGVPMEIVLNRESKRKTPAMLSIRKDERQFGENSMTVRLRYPKSSYAYVVELLGKKYEHPFVQQFKQWFPYYNLVQDPDRGTVLFEDEGKTYTPEELVAMLLAECRDLAQSYAEQPVRDAVITVPAFWNQAERRAMVKAAEIADVNLLQLLNDNAAAGISYGMFRRKEFNETATHVLIYDMGALKTTATVYEYQLVKDAATKEKNPQMTILGVGYDRTLGGLPMTFLFRDHLANAFRQQHAKKAKTDIGENPRAMLKLLKEAERVKQVLSANPDHYAQVEGLHEDIDFRVKVTREELDALCSDYFDRVPGPVNDALAMAEVPLESIDYVVLMGAGTRALKVQEKLQEAVKGRDLGKYLNTDEAIAMGAVYQAAHRSKGFKVKKFIVKDITLFPIQVDFAREVNDTAPEARRTVHRTLFDLKNPFPQKKVMTFNKHTNDFDLHVNYGKLAHLNKDQLSYFGELNVSRVDLRDVSKALQAQEGEGAESKGIKVHFQMDEGGLLTITSAEAVFEKTIEEGENDTDGKQSTFQKIGKTLSSIFGSGGEEQKDADGKEKKDGTDSETKKEEKPDGAKPEDKEKKEEQKAEKPSEGEGKEAPKPKEKDDKKKDNKTDEKKPQKATPSKPKVIKVPVKLEHSAMDLLDLSQESSKAAVDKLKAFQKMEKEKRDREKAHNTLESFVFETGHKLDMDEYKLVTTEKERDAIREKLKEVSDWLEEQGVDTLTKDFEKKLDALKDVTKDLFYKFEEQKERPRAIEAMKQMLNYSSTFLAGMKNLTEDLQIFTETEISTLEKLITDAQKWWEGKQAEQAKLSPHDTPVITLMGVAEKVSALDREVKYLLNKAKFAKPKVKKPSTEGEGRNETETEKGPENETEPEGTATEEKKQQQPKEGEDSEVEVEEEETPTVSGQAGEKEHEEL